MLRRRRRARSRLLRHRDDMTTHYHQPLPPPPGEAVSVAAFGAVGDGKTDDTAAVSAAIKYVQGQAHRPVLRFPAGAFVLSSSLQADTFVVEGAGPANTQLVFSNTKATPPIGSAAGGYAFVVGVSWAQLHKDPPCFPGVRNLSIVAGTGTLNGLLFHSVFQANAVCENVQVSGFAATGAVGVGLCNVQDMPFINLKVSACWVGLQLSPAQKPGEKNYNTNLTFINYVGQSNLSWSIGCLPGAGGCDNVTFVGGVSQSAAATLVNIATCGSLTFLGHYFETPNTKHQELILADVANATIQGCHFTSIGAQVIASGQKAHLAVCGCSFPSKFAQEPGRTLPSGARVVLSGGINATVNACSPQLSVGQGCVATLVGFDHRINTTGGPGKIIDLSNPSTKVLLETGKSTVDQMGPACACRTAARDRPYRREVALQWATLVLLTAAILALAIALQDVRASVHCI